MKFTRLLIAAFMLLVSCYSLGFGLGLIEPSPQVLLPPIGLFLCLVFYLLYPFVDEKWKEWKERENAARGVAPEVIHNSLGAIDPVSLQERVFPVPPEKDQMIQDAGLSHAPLSNRVLSESPALPSFANEPPTTSDRISLPEASVTVPDPEAEPQRAPTRTEIDPKAVRECIRRILSALDGNPTPNELIPEIERFFELVPEAARDDLPKRTRTLAERLIIARRFERSGKTQERFCADTVTGKPPNKRAYDEGLSVSFLQDAERDLHVVEGLGRQRQPSLRAAEGKPSKGKPKRKDGKGKAN